jgi:2',3'-cyclic-nucleotide 2'-phosphodiesterase/3'-nucleotidase
MRPTRSTLLAALLPVLLASGVRAEEVRVTVLHTSDLHGRLTGFQHLEERAAAGGLARVATLVAAARAEGELLLLDAGDAMQGDAVGAVWRMGSLPELPEPVMAVMSALRYDALAPGNHEFDFGVESLAQARGAARFPWIAANVAGGREPFAPSITREIRGVKVGVVGVCTPAVPAWTDSIRLGGYRFEDPVVAARREVRRLRESERCDVVVLLAHTGLAVDSVSGAARAGQRADENWGERLANDVPGVDAVILAHTHERIAERAIAGVPVTQAGRFGEVLGRIDFTLERERRGRPWTLARTETALLAVTDSIPEDPAILAIAAPYVEEADRVLGRAVARTARPVGAPHVRLADGPLWELLHRVQLRASGADVSLAPVFRPDAGLAAGPVTVRQLMRLYPYENRLVVLELTGAQIQAALEHSARYFNTYGFAHDSALVGSAVAGDNFDSAEGLTYEIDLTQPAGQRIVRLRFQDEALDPARRLKVVMSDYRAGGGGGYTMFEGAPALWWSDQGARDLLIAYVASHGPGGEHTPNWRLIPDYVLTPARPLIDRLVRLGKAPIDDVRRLGASEPARRGDLAYWLARAFDWQAPRRSGAFVDVSDGLAPWVDALMERKVIGPTAQRDRFEPMETASVWISLDWCENAARVAKYRLSSRVGDPSFRRSLLTGTGVALDADGRPQHHATFTRAQLLGMIANVRFPELRALSTSDFHGAVFPGTDRRSNREYGGTLALASLIGRLRAENPEGTVLLDGGDCFQGTMVSNLQSGRPVVEQMNALAYTAGAIGNHEFDWGVDTLIARVREMQFAALGANMIEKKTGRNPRWVKSDTLVARRGVRVGVVGLCYRNTPRVTLSAHVEPYRFDGDSAAAAEAVPRLRQEDGAEVVVAVGHVSAESGPNRRARGGDLVRLARGVGGVDAWFGGHSHNFIEDEVNGIPLLIPAAFGRAVAVCDLVVDPVADRVVERRYRLETAWVDENPADSAWIARVERWNAGIAPIAETPLGTVRARLDRNGPETTIGNLITDAMRAASGADIALQNSGGMRADLDSGVVTRGDVYAIMPFDNTIVIGELTGAELEVAIDEAMTRDRVTQVSGMRYAYDLTRPELDRVTEVTDLNGAPLDPARVYRVAYNNFMATGGDDYATLAKARNMVDTNRPIRDAIEDFVRAASGAGRTLEVSRDGRIRKVEAEQPVESR